MPIIEPARAVQLARIRMALRRATGQSADVEAALTGPRETAETAIRAWRALGAADLNALLDQWLGTAPATVLSNTAARPSRSAAAANAGPAAPPTPSTTTRPPTNPVSPVEPTAPPDPAKPPPDRRYLRGAR